MRRYRRSMRRRRCSMWRRLRLARRRRRSRGGHSMRRYRRSMRSYRRYWCGVFGDIGDCPVWKSHTANRHRHFAYVCAKKFSFRISTKNLYLTLSMFASPRKVWGTWNGALVMVVNHTHSHNGTMLQLASKFKQCQAYKAMTQYCLWFVLPVSNFLSNKCLLKTLTT